MQFSDDAVWIEPGHQTRTWQSCNYFAGEQRLFHERCYVHTLPRLARRQPTPAALHWLAAGPSGDATEQWLEGRGPTHEIAALAAKHGGRAMEEFYTEEGQPPLFFLAFNDTDKALAFCRTADFDRLCLTTAKV